MENKRIIQVDEKVPVKLLIPLSIQHMFAMSVHLCLFRLCLVLIRQSCCL